MEVNTNKHSGNFKCDDKIIISEEFPQELRTSISNLITKEDYITSTIEVRKISTGGNNFLGELYELDVKGQTSVGYKETYIFMKRIIENDEFRVYSIPEVYKKETFVYKELSKIFDDLQENAKVPSNERFQFVKSYEETNADVIILENLAKKGFKTMARMETMSLEFAKLCVEQLAKFHGLSLVLEKQRPEYFETKIKPIKQSFIYDDYWNALVKNMCDFSVEKMDNTTKEKVAKFFALSLDKYPKYMNGLHSNIRCLCHGDYKMNNILIKENGGSITAAMPIDFQQVYYGCPVIDLIYFIYAASDRQFRKQHFDNLIDLYYTSLTRFLNYFGVIPFTRDEFELCVSESLDYALMVTLYMLPMFYVCDDVPDLSKDELLDMKLSVDPRFYDRMKEIIDEFVDAGVL